MQTVDLQGPVVDLTSVYSSETWCEIYVVVPLLFYWLLLAFLSVTCLSSSRDLCIS